MDTINNTDAAELISKYAELTGKGFERAKARIITDIGENMDIDVTDAFNVVHLGVARLLIDTQREISTGNKEYDGIYTVTSLIFAVCTFMQAQHAIASQSKVLKILEGAPFNIRQMGAIMAASPSIKERGGHTSALVDALYGSFMSNLVKSIERT